MGSAEIVKSAYMVDPNDGISLIKRDEAGPNIDKEYWQRVNQVLNYKQYFTRMRHGFFRVTMC